MSKKRMGRHFCPLNQVPEGLDSGKMSHEDVVRWRISDT